jgi:cyclophilin family peptidyl-prolyl cis-trans isomerase
MRFLPSLVSLVLLACSSSSQVVALVPGDAGTPAKDSSTPVVDSSTPKPAFPEGFTAEPELSPTPVRTFTKAEQVLDAAKDYVAVIETDAGSVTLNLLAQDTPITCNSFVFLARNHYFDGVAFHRVIEGFMAQTGDPNSVSGDPGTWGTGGPGYTFGLEVKPELNFDGEGVVGMARTSNPNSNGSQFFITFAAQTSLNQKYTVFAKVLAGADTLPKIVRGEPPATPSHMTTVKIWSRAR